MFKNKLERIILEEIDKILLEKGVPAEKLLKEQNVGVLRIANSLRRAFKTRMSITLAGQGGRRGALSECRNN